MLLLVALPVAGLAGGAVMVRSHIASPQQRADLELGRTGAWLQVVGGADPTRTQDPRRPYDNTVAQDADGRPANAERPAPTSPASVLPAGTRTIELHEQGSLFVKTATGVGQVAVTAGPAWDPALRGRYVILGGSAPANSSEAMVTPGMLDRLGAKIGDRVTLADSGAGYTISGTMRRLDQLASDEEVYLPSSALGDVPGLARWYTPDWQPTTAQLADLNHAGFIAYGRDLATRAANGGDNETSQNVWTALLIGTVAAVFCGYLVVMLAGAAFAVAARRQQRSLAVAGSVGATPADAFRVVLLQGTVLGAAGGLVGATVGVGLAAAVLAVTDNGALDTFWGNWGVKVPWSVLLGILIFAVVVGTVAAIVPARAATKGDTLGALRGARRPARLNARRPVWGGLLMVLGLAGTVVGGLTLAALNLHEPVEDELPLRSIALWAVVLSPVVFQIGMLLAGHWVLTGIARVASRLGFAPRLASRDAAANPSRVIPAFAAIAVCVFLASFALSATATSSAANSRMYSWSGPLGSVQVSAWGQDASHATTTLRTIDDLLAPTNPTSTIVQYFPQDAPTDPGTGIGDPHFGVWATSSPCNGCATGDAVVSPGAVSVVDPDKLGALLDVSVPARIVDLMKRGGAVQVSSPRDPSIGKEGTITLQEWATSALNDYTERMTNPSGTTGDLPRPRRSIELPFTRFAADRTSGTAQVVIAPATAKRLGMTVVPQFVVAVYPRPIDTPTLDRLTAAAKNVRVGESGTLDVRAERGPDPAAPWLWLIMAVAGVLVIGASAVSLGLARFERRPDDATLAAVGANRGVRRRINAWQAGIIAGIGTVVGTIAGVIPVWGLLSGNTYFRFAQDVPWVWLILLALGLPALVAVVSWAVPPRHPDLTRRTAIA
ncbi:hypothetical protein LK09_08570 [Microbacterium mangrovi]|uniref:ABC3 transporter permease C-terminal domain-containing protein n=1 Tax=Microbacterium mangrovi TaxID=1348253 RepID=A0A0B2AAU9_9MICO|nr:ABC transporter permease [Microbacterium mangrovi]KHK98898.1 hypothetical protein LK09_08570 [Microbacterium mangrovi]